MTGVQTCALPILLNLALSLITGKNGNVIKPRVKKNKTEQLSRVKDKAEVFTPSWICNKQNNLIDNAWFGIENVFNVETYKGWKSVDTKIPFPTADGKKWQDYVLNIILEVSCGEAPYLVSRYDTITGKSIEVANRIGLLDRKLRIISENTETFEDWYKWTVIAFQSTYGFEWQGDSLLLARESLLFSFIDYHQAKFCTRPNNKYLKEIAQIISWNVWQMDGLRGVIPYSCSVSKIATLDLFETKEVEQECEGCLKGNIHKHNGIYCQIKDWKTGDILRYTSLLKK